MLKPASFVFLEETVIAVRVEDFLGESCLTRIVCFKTHVRNVSSNVRRKTGALLKLKSRDMSEVDLTYIYTSMIRQSAEYASPSWNSMLTAEQSFDIEKQQNQAMKNIVGVGISSKKMRSGLGLDTLESRREKSLIAFATKCGTNPRFQSLVCTKAKSTLQ